MCAAFGDPVLVKGTHSELSAENTGLDARLRKVEQDDAATGEVPVLEYVWAAAGARYDPGTDLARQWAAKLCRLLKAGRKDEVLAGLRRTGGGECAKAARYIAERRDRMRYDEYLARGLPVGSGRVEAGKQDRRRTAHEVHRHALDGGRREPGAVGALRTAQRLVRRVLG